jgi:hypothetical protein
MKMRAVVVLCGVCEAPARYEVRVSGGARREGRRGTHFKFALNLLLHFVLCNLALPAPGRILRRMLRSGERTSSRLRDDLVPVHEKDVRSEVFL